MDGETKDHNYFKALAVMDYCLNLMLMCGKCVSIKGELEIEPKPSFSIGKLVVGIPMQVPESEEVNDLAKKLSKVLSNLKDSEIIEFRALFNDFAEAQREIEIPHRFRSIFAVFNNLSDKFGYMNGISINYESNLRKHFVLTIKQAYVGAYYGRFRDICGKLINEELVDHFKPDKNYSDGLKNALANLPSGTLLDDEVAYYAMKCVQQIRNKMNHGNYNFVDYSSINAAYELNLLLTQHLLRERVGIMSLGGD